MPGSVSTPVVLREEADIDRLFRLEILPGRAAVLTVGSFGGEHKSRSQSGGVRKTILPHSKLAVWVPRFILHPPAGAKNNALLEVDAQAPGASACK